MERTKTFIKKIISFSGGVESTTMCVLFGGSTDAVFADTGFEHKEVYEQIEKVQKWGREFHRPDFTIHKVQSRHGTLPNRIVSQHYYPSFTSRYCTREFKIEPIDKFLEQYKENKCELMIGLNYSERNLRKGNHGNKHWIKISYPLIQHGLNRNACYVILDKVKLNPNYPSHMKRGGCIGCYYKSLNSYMSMAINAPDEFAIVEKLEADFNADRSEGSVYFKILGSAEKPSMPEIKRRALKKKSLNLFKDDDITTVINDVTSCGVFCNR